jgi:Na+-exporting ATPase
MALSYGIQDYVEGGVITAVIVLNIVIGFYQEFQAEKKMDALRALGSPSATVLRDGQEENIPSREVVPGDIVKVKTGDTIPSDLRLFEVMNLECDEKILTGEAMPVAKETDFRSDGDELHVGIGDRLNMAYSSSTVTKGRATGIGKFTGFFCHFLANMLQLCSLAWGLKLAKSQRPCKARHGSQTEACRENTASFSQSKALVFAYTTALASSWA